MTQDQLLELAKWHDDYGASHRRERLAEPQRHYQWARDLRAIADEIERLQARAEVDLVEGQAQEQEIDRLCAMLQKIANRPLGETGVKLQAEIVATLKRAAGNGSKQLK